jgi:hypothetical protein
MLTLAFSYHVNKNPGRVIETASHNINWSGDRRGKSFCISFSGIPSIAELF